MTEQLSYTETVLPEDRRAWEVTFKGALQILQRDQAKRRRGDLVLDQDLLYLGRLLWQQHEQPVPIKGRVVRMWELYEGRAARSFIPRGALQDGLPGIPAPAEEYTVERVSGESRTLIVRPPTSLQEFGPHGYPVIAWELPLNLIQMVSPEEVVQTRIDAWADA